MILRRNARDRYSTVAREWRGETAVLIGGGPSLTVGQIELVRAAHAAGQVRCIVVNDGFLLAPWADVCYFADAKWWRWTTDGTPKPGFTAEEVRDRFASFAGQKCSIQSMRAAIPDDSVHMLRNRDFPHHGEGLSLDHGALVTGRNGGFQALNLAVLAGIQAAILIGYDGAPRDGRTHWFGDHPRVERPTVYPEIRRGFTAARRALAAAGVRVMNCSPGSAIDAFDKVELEEALAFTGIET